MVRLASMTPTTSIERSIHRWGECHYRKAEGRKVQGVAQWAAVAVENHLDQVVGAKVQEEVSAKS